MKCPFKVKICTKCKRILIAYSGNFKKCKNTKDDLYPSCKECDKLYRNKKENKEKAKQYSVEYREKNKEKLKEDKKIWYKENREEVLEMRKNYYEENKEQISEYQKQYREENKEELKEYRKQYREENKEEIKKRERERYKKNREKNIERNRQYRKENPHIQFNNHSKRRYLEENQGNGITKEQWLEMMKYFNWCCAYSGEYIGGDSKFRTIDHIMALNNGGLNEIWNCVPMYRLHNISKYTNDMLDWYRKQDFFSEERLEKIYQWIEYAYKKWSKKRRKSNKKC